MTTKGSVSGTLAGLMVLGHPNNQKISIYGDIEAPLSGNVYFRTSLYNYQTWRARARYQLTSSLNRSTDFNVLNNQNPTPGTHYDYLALQESLSPSWVPTGQDLGFSGLLHPLYRAVEYLLPGAAEPPAATVLLS